MGLLDSDQLRGVGGGRVAHLARRGIPVMRQARAALRAVIRCQLATYESPGSCEQKGFWR